MLPVGGIFSLYCINYSTAMIRFDKVRKKYTKQLFEPSCMAVHDLSFSLEKGKSLGLIGANGAGKTTSIKLIMDFIRPDSGEILLFNEKPGSTFVKRRTGYLPEVANFPRNVSLDDLLRFAGKSCGVAKRVQCDRSQELLTLLNLWEVRKQPLRTYSKGMQQRANFVVALINDPELLILDEPMSGLDPIGRKMIIELISSLKNQGKTILFCSHILEDVDRLVDNVLLLHKGRKLFYGKPVELTEQEGVSFFADAFVTRVVREEAHGECI